MSLKNKSMYAILGILNLSPGTGYDIKKYCDTVLSGFWNENFGHIYPTLKMLLKDGMIEADTGKQKAKESDSRVSVSRADRKIKYHITEKGKQELLVWLGEETIPQPVRSEFMLKLLFSNGQPHEQIIKMLESYRKMHEENIDKYNEMMRFLELKDSEISNERIVYLQAVLRRGIISDEATIRWCDETIKTFNGG